MEESKIELGRISKVSTIGMPVSVYDVFGYLSPALTSVVLAIGFERWGQYVAGKEFRAILLPVLENNIPPHTESWLYQGFIVVAAVCLLYTYGHIISSASSLVIDRLLVFRGLGYPYEKLLALNTAWIKKSEYLRWGIQGVFVSSVALTISMYSTYFFYLDKGISIYARYVASYPYLDVLRLFSLAGAVKLIAGLSALGLFGALLVIFLEMLRRILDAKLKTPGENYRVLVSFLSISRVPALLFSKIVYRQNGFSKAFRKRYEDAFKECFKLDSRLEETNNYWMTCAYVELHSPRLYIKLTNWFHMYSYSRNVAMSLFLNFLLSTVCLFRNSHLIDSDYIYGANLVVGNVTLLRLIPLGFLVAALIMLYRYYYLYAGYYTKFLLRAFVMINCKERTQA
ncbi:MAG: hypothetical protein GC168_07890 [Candidatus Hydrogenedens sp.]|nr:hypothetical protein [Candidatus Hydrogenedens sp.]